MTKGLATIRVRASSPISVAFLIFILDININYTVFSHSLCHLNCSLNAPRF